MPLSIAIFGAGNIGRAFIGPVFNRAGWTVYFIDVQTEMVKALKAEKRYELVHCCTDGRLRSEWIEGIEALHGIEDQVAVLDLLHQVDLIATCVGARGLPSIAKILSQVESSKDVLLAENLHGAGELMMGLAPKHGYVETSIGKMVPVVSEQDRLESPLRVIAETYNDLIVDAKGFKHAIPQNVPDLKPVDPIAAYVDRKLYLHNMGHAAAAYLGHQANREIKTIWQVMENESLRMRVRQVMMSAAKALSQRWAGCLSLESLEDHVDDLLHRFGNRALGDTIYRVGRDLRRKLGPMDRIVGTMRLLQEEGLACDDLAEVYIAALDFDARDDRGRPHMEDQFFRRGLLVQGLETTMRETSELTAQEDLSIVQSILNASSIPIRA